MVNSSELPFVTYRPIVPLDIIVSVTNRGKGEASAIFPIEDGSDECEVHQPIVPKRYEPILYFFVPSASVVAWRHAGVVDLSCPYWIPRSGRMISGRILVEISCSRSMQCNGCVSDFWPFDETQRTNLSRLSTFWPRSIRSRLSYNAQIQIAQSL